MKIAILGTRGIPNNYGGFEQLAQYLSLGLMEKGHEVYVYNSHKHVYKEKQWRGVHIIHQYDPEKSIGTIGQFIYDLNCVVNSRKQKFDVILNLGYTSSSIWMKLFPRTSKIITNMDGLEWKRTKYSRKVQAFLKYAESLAVKNSDDLVSDSPAIKNYIFKKYQKSSTFIAYGANLFETPDNAALDNLNVKAFGYNMLIARMEPENNIETILDGVDAAKLNYPFLVIGSVNNKFGLYLTKKYSNNPQIRFLGPIYDESVINNLRYFSNIYFHGHSVGGTNPSLLEAMGCKSLIAAHDNEFNRAVLGTDAYYFTESRDIVKLVHHFERTTEENTLYITNNYNKIKYDYTWPKIVDEYEQMIINSKKEQ